MQRQRKGRVVGIVVMLLALSLFMSYLTVVTSTVSYIATVTFTPLSITNAFISYRSNTGLNLLSSPKERTWNGTAWSTLETEMTSTGASVLWVRAAYCPVPSRGYEKIVVTLSNDAFLDVSVWNGSSWKTTNNIGQVNTGADVYQSFDVAYEKTSSRAIFVYAVLSSDSTRDLAYRVWNGTVWSNEAYIDDLGHGSHANYRWVELESNPTAGLNEVALIAVDQTNADCNGWIWNGSAWGNFQELENALAAVRDNKLMGVSYEQNSGQAMFVWADGGFLDSRKFNGTAWENELPAISISSTNNVRWISIKADPKSNQLMAITIDGGNDLNSAFWNGTAWSSPYEHDADVSHIDSRCADFDWEPSGNTGLLVWSTASGSVSYKTFSALSSWSVSSTASNPVFHPWILLRKNPRNGDTKILGATLNGNQDLFGFRWNGSSLIFEATPFTTDTATIAYECFDLAFQIFN